MVADQIYMIHADAVCAMLYVSHAHNKHSICDQGLDAAKVKNDIYCMGCRLCKNEGNLIASFLRYI